MKSSPTIRVESTPAASPWSEALDTHGQGLWDWDIPGNRVWSSPEYRATLGAEPDANGFTGFEDWAARLHPDDSNAVRNALDAHLRGESPAFFSEHRLRCADGSYRWVAARGRIIARDETGRPLRMLGTQLDIHHHKLAELALQESASLFRRIFDDAPIGLALLSLQGRWLDTNRALCDLLGYDEQELLQRRFLDLTHPDDVDADRTLMQALLTGQQARVRRHKRYLAKDGSPIPVQVDVSIVRDADDNPQYFISQVQDVRERCRFEDALYDEKELAQVTLASIADGVLRTGCDGRISFCNAAAAQLLGVERPSDVLGRLFADAVALYADCGTRLNGPDDPGAEWPPLAQLHSARGDVVPVEISLAPITGRSGSRIGSVCVLHDLSHTRRLSEQLIYQASHDALTDLPNRREFEAELEHWLSTARLGADRHTLLYLDLDHFKLINENAGHSVGDRLVRDLARRLREALPAQAVLARTGGDEFAVLLPHSTPAQACLLGESLLLSIDTLRFEHEGLAYQIAASIGISAIDANSRDANSVLAAADTACYIAKRNGGHRVQLYHPGDDAVRQAFLDIDWASRIQQALESGQVELHAQRIISLDGSALPNYEVLIRVRDEHGQLQAPSAFLTAAERYGLSGRVDRWVVEQTLRRLAAHLREAGSLPFGSLSLNLTGHSVSDVAFADFLFDALARHGVPPQALRFEITEGTALRSFAVARRLVSRLREMGCRVMLDDFGSGFTSFDYLRQMMVDGLKIDQAYTQGLGNDRLNQTIVSSICRISEVLQLEVVAEGVETESTLAALRELGVAIVQGHLFHIAEPLDGLLR
ncbi:PAS domain-containing protein [Solimonas flava]|uniref:PAS domain-containing protein n=1 Tax=Solimonas flava TaxID=415849 RepID=UPI00040ED8E5|nr:PAS domain-containing protein [Solimonas flava]